MKIKLLGFVSLLTIGYILYNELKENIDKENIEICRKKLKELGYNIDNSYCLNLKDDNILKYYFYNNDIFNEVYFDKTTKKIERIREV